MTIAEDLLRRHIETLVADNARWQMLLAEDVVWELPFAPALGHPARGTGKGRTVRRVVRGSHRELPLLRREGPGLRRPGGRRRGGQGRGTDQGDRACLPSGVRGLPACFCGEDRVPARVLRSDQGGEGDEHAHPRPRLVTPWGAGRWEYRRHKASLSELVALLSASAGGSRGPPPQVQISSASFTKSSTKVSSGALFGCVRFSRDSVCTASK
jgi:hypothetical protein